ncbi:MAG: hypothetical protein IT345_07390 [Trueperaceae bacterium]|nr:hypothetical protein [Trueperaceae bacterium]
MVHAANANSIDARRKALEDAIEDAIAALDLLEPDPDLEDNRDAEPWLGGSGMSGEDDLEHDDSEQEPSLGWTTTINQTAHSFHGRSNGWEVVDGEEEHDGREPEEDREPSLGAPENHPGSWMGSGGSQVIWARGGTFELEYDASEHGEPEESY